MRLVVVSDIHGNLDALRAVLREAGDDPVLCAGDVTGYGAYPAECVHLTQSLGFRCVRGNHDDAIAGADAVDDDWFHDEARQAITIHRRLLGEEDKAWLRSLPTELAMPFDWTSEVPRSPGEGAAASVSMFHASPTEHLTQYVYPRDMEALAHLFLGHTGARVVVLGHTHVPHVVRRPEGVVLNPGSVGQPRDGDPQASYAVLEVGDDEEPRAEIHRVEYDIDAAAQAIEDRGLPLRFARRLYTGT